MREMKQLEATPLKANLSNFTLPFAEDKIDLRSVFYTLLEEKKVILAVTLMSLILGVFYAMTKVPQYQADVLLQMESKQASSALLGNTSLLSSIGGGVPTADIQIALIKSRFILLPVVQSLGLDITVSPNYFPMLGAWFARNHSAALQKPFFGMSQYAWGGEQLQIAKMELAPQDKGKSFKLVSGKNHTYQLLTSSGKLILKGKVGQLEQASNEYVSNLAILIASLEANPGTEFSISKSSAENIADKIASQIQISDLGQLYQIDKTGVLQMSLTGANPRLVVELLNAIAKNAVQKDTERKSIEAAKTLRFLDKQLPLMQASLNSVETALNKYRMKSGTVDLNLKSRALLKQLTDLQREIEKINATRITLLQQYTPLHPYVAALKDKKIALQQEVTYLENQLQALPAPDQVMLSLIREIKVRNQLYLSMLHKMQELKIIKAGTTSDVRILSAANLPNSSLPMGRGVVILVSILAGLVLGSLCVFVRKMFHQYVEDPNWVEQHFGVPTFAIIPYSKEQNSNMLSSKDNPNKNLLLLAQTQPRDLAIEALRSLRTSLQFALMGAKNNIISIMGVSPGIGKSFVSVNFSHILADTNKRVLLIDGDIRKGYLHHYFAAMQAPGLTEAITGEVNLDDVIKKTHLPHLDFISTGKFPPNPSELLMSEKFKDLMALLSGKYDFVIIDTAPVLAVTDGAIIGSQTGVNFLLVASGRHQAEEIELTMNRLQSTGVKVHGTIFNNLSASNQVKGRYNYYYAYGEN